MFPKFQKPKLPKMGEIVQKSDFNTVRHAEMPGAHHINFPGEFHKPRVAKVHKRF